MSPDVEGKKQFFDVQCVFHEARGSVCFVGLVAVADYYFTAGCHPPRHFGSSVLSIKYPIPNKKSEFW
jgi:hypothetical protein